MQKLKALINPCVLESQELTPYDKSKLTNVVNTKGDFKVYFRGVDDPGSVKKFDDLADVVRYVKPRDGGPDYRRDGGLQGEYGQYAFEGFNWDNILDGDPRSDGAKYKVYLTNLPLKLTWVHEIPDEKFPPFIGDRGVVYSSAYSDAWHGYQPGDSGYDTSATIFYDKPYTGEWGKRERLYHCLLGANQFWNIPAQKTLEAAKEAILKAIPLYKQYIKDKYGHED
jgi:hypothetical protein